MLIAEVQPAEITLAIWCVAGHDPKFVKFGGDDTSFGIGVTVAVTRDAVSSDNVRRKAVDIAKGGRFGKDSGTAIALFDGTIEMFFVLW